MRNILTILMVTLVFGFASEDLGAQDEPKLADDEIKQILINMSIASYPGNCPCPYSRASNGSLCGKRSAYSKPGGYSPMCYKSDVSDAQVQVYRKKH